MNLTLIISLLHNIFRYVFVEHSVISHDDFVKKKLSDSKQYRLDYYLEFRQEESIKSNIADRLIKAFENLVNLNGGRIIKESF